MSTSRNSIWTPANIVTCVRVVLIPIFLILVALSQPADSGFISWSRFFVAIFYIFISLTDKIDGYLARSRNEVTNFGKFLDPIADKLAVVAALVVLVEWHVVPVWTVVVIVAREFLVSGLRMIVASEGVVVAASNLGKWKTATTMTSLGIIFVALSLADHPVTTFLMTVGIIVYYVSVALTIWSGVDYFVKCWPYVVEQ
ncbi:MAG: CDP-diacylglycerol--glycerol-3-phosphate 3-phosphatidyltransferase [Atopobiaceae bacterium]|nr:CDP-diacylglycerol--glycerol-3-phosphate 3-phosphatidyltransferase [Atopobiaceae bacterium]